MKTDKQNWCGCPIRFAMRVFGDKWTLLIIRDMALFAKRHYSDFLNAGEGIATNVLADRLAKLETEGVVVKNPDPENQTKFVYQLTEKGLDLIPVLVSFVEWSARYDQDSLVPEHVLEALQADRDQFVADLRQACQENRSLILP